MKIIIGLGNIGTKYINTRHNIGFIFLDKLQNYLENKSIEIEWKDEKKLKALTTKIKYNNKTLLLAKPTTFMNLSGHAVVKILHYFKEKPENLIVIYDDIDLNIGTIRIRHKGSAGTHNGMKSIIQELGTDSFTRIRLGIESRGEESPKEQDLTSFVLSRFNKEEESILKNTFDEAISKVEEIL